MKKGFPYFLILGLVLILGLLINRTPAPPGQPFTITDYDHRADSLLRLQADSIKNQQQAIAVQRDAIRMLEVRNQRTRIEADSLRRMYHAAIQGLTHIDTDSLLGIFYDYTDLHQQAKTGMHARDPTDSTLIQTQRIEASVHIFLQFDSISAENTSLQSDTLNKLMKIQAYEQIDKNQLDIIRSLGQTITIKDGQITERDKALIKERRKTRLVGIIAILVLIADAIW